MAPSTVAPDNEVENVTAWRALGRECKERYAQAQPFPHLVQRDLLPLELVLAAEKEELPRALTLPLQSHHRQRKAESTTTAGPAAQRCLAIMKSPAFVTFVEEVTGLTNLRVDDTNYFAGLHANGRGSFSSLHRDFVVHPVTKKWHRANALLFLNSDWRDEYGGELELWPSDASGCGASIKPEAGTLVIFETHNGTLHGIPDPVVCPEGRMRLSLAVYYYSDDEPPPGPLHQPRLRRARRPQDHWWIAVPELYEVIWVFILGPLATVLRPFRRGIHRLRARRS